jgi:hypothetical protein
MSTAVLETTVSIGFSPVAFIVSPDSTVVSNRALTRRGILTNEIHNSVSNTKSACSLNTATLDWTNVQHDEGTFENPLHNCDSVFIDSVEVLILKPVIVWSRDKRVQVDFFDKGLLEAEYANSFKLSTLTSWQKQQALQGLFFF